jgi:hypothetical protein
LRRADHSSKESYRLCKKDLETEIWGQGPRKGCRAIGKKNHLRICEWPKSLQNFTTMFSSMLKLTTVGIYKTKANE